MLCCCITCQAFAKKASTEKWDISADKLVRYETPRRIIAEGNVILTKREKLPPQRSEAEIRAAAWSELLEEKLEEKAPAADDVDRSSTPQYQSTMTVQADWLAYDISEQTITVKGNVQITTLDDQLFAKEGTLNLVDETGSFSEATIIHKGNAFHLEGKIIEKTGLDTYRISKGWVITCKLDENEAPPWSFSSSETKIRQGGYAILKHAKFNIRNVPVFYTPYLLVPVKSERQTGFIVPEISSSHNSGFGFNLPFFLNISDSTDATFYPEYLQYRGFRPGLEFRYVASAINKGMLTANYLNDKLSDPSETDYFNDTGYTHDNSSRYWLRGKADHTIASWQSRLDVDIVSDQDYLTEFDSGITGFDKTQSRYVETFGRGFQNQSDTLRENTFKTLRSWEGMSLQMDLLAINEADTNAGNADTPLWKLPSIDFSGVVPINETIFSLDWDTNYVNYWREDGIGGHRIDLQPTVSAPIPLGPYLESRAEVGLRDTIYLVQPYGNAEWDKDDIQNRLFPEFEIEVATTLERDYFLNSESERTVSHQLRPYVIYGYLPEVGQSNLPQFDDIDFIDSKHLITYGMDNYLTTFTDNKGGYENENNYAELKVEQSFDLRSEASDQPFSELFTELKWWPLSGTALSYKTFYDVYDNEFTRHTFESQYNNSRGDYLTLDYSFNQDENIEQLNAYFLAHLVNGWSAGGSIEHSFSQDETVEAKGSLIYQTACWSIKFETRHTPDDTSYLVVFSLANIGSPLGINF